MHTLEENRCPCHFWARLLWATFWVWAISESELFLNFITRLQSESQIVPILALWAFFLLRILCLPAQIQSPLSRLCILSQRKISILIASNNWIIAIGIPHLQLVGSLVICSTLLCTHSKANDATLQRVHEVFTSTSRFQGLIPIPLIHYSVYGTSTFLGRQMTFLILLPCKMPA